MTVKAKATPNMEVEVEGGDPNGQIWVPGTSLSNQGMYFCSVDSTTGVAIGAASTANPRVDTIVARVKDSFYVGGPNEFLLEVIAGTPKAGISKPPKTKAEAEADGAGAVPVSSYVLAYVLVPQNASTITSGDIENVSRQGGLGLAPPPMLPMNSYSENVTAKAGETLLTTAALVTLPSSPSTNDMVGVWCGAGETTIKAAVGNRIDGDFVNNVASIKLTALQHVILQLDPFGSWVIIAGEPKNENTYSAQTVRSFGTTYEPSASRPTSVILNTKLDGEKEDGYLIVYCGGVLICNQNIDATNPWLSLSFICPAGQTWEATPGAGELKSSYLTL